MTTLPDQVKSNTAIVLVPGSFSPTSFYTHVVRILSQQGFEHISPTPLLSACPPSDLRTPPAKLEDDSLYIREVIQAHLSKGRDVVLVANSYGGFPSTEAISGLPSRASLTTESDSTQTGAVVGMIYLSSFVPLPGDSIRNVMAEYLFEPLKTGAKGEYMTLPEGSGPGIFKDTAFTNEAQIQAWFETMTRHSSDSFDGQVKNDMWSEGENRFKGRVVYIAGDNDDVVPIALAQSMINKVEEISGKKDVVKYIQIEGGGHGMHLSRPEVVVKAITDVLEGL
ncbi:hypothetical protein LTR64_003987 [Lithohypha guttulata]|uniref:uncharacterized protein n=1 Tax=Lithohypha guttulata TaxID=1690604 RepID=UPI002DE190E4|nr:hypothetical protein LTR51_006718 [Lithohypha guttulata]